MVSIINNWRIILCVTGIVCLCIFLYAIYHLAASQGYTKCQTEHNRYIVESNRQEKEIIQTVRKTSVNEQRILLKKWQIN